MTVLIHQRIADGRPEVSSKETEESEELDKAMMEFERCDRIIGVCLCVAALAAAVTLALLV